MHALLADPRSHPEARDNAAVRAAARHGHGAIVAALLKDSRVDPTALSNAAFRSACKEGHAAVVAQLLADARVSSSIRSTGLSYALHDAVVNGHVAVVQRLLADPRTNPAADGNAAVQVAAEDPSAIREWTHQPTATLPYGMHASMGTPLQSPACSHIRVWIHVQIVALRCAWQLLMAISLW